MSPKRNKPLSRFRALSVVCVCVFLRCFHSSFFFSWVCVCLLMVLLSYRCIIKAYNVNFFVWLSVYTAWCLFIFFFFMSHAFLLRQIIDTQEKHNRLFFFVRYKHAVPWFSLLLPPSSSIPSSVIKIKNLNIYMKRLFLYWENASYCRIKWTEYLGTYFEK